MRGFKQVSATDRAGNLATTDVPVWFDDTKPTVTFDILPKPTLLQTSNPPTLQGEYTYCLNQHYLSLI